MQLERREHPDPARSDGRPVPRDLGGTSATASSQADISSSMASLDPQRSSKDEALILDLGRRVRPFLTPDDVDAVAVVIHQRTGLRIFREDEGQFI
jgi:hypothetical protein